MDQLRARVDSGVSLSSPEKPVKPQSRARVQSILRHPLPRCDWIERSVSMMPRHPLHKLKQNLLRARHPPDRFEEQSFVVSACMKLCHIFLNYVLREYCNLKREEMSCLHLVLRHRE